MIFVRKVLACSVSIVRLFLFSLTAQETQEGRLLLFPDIHKDKVAFVYGGDIWLASSVGGDGAADDFESRARAVSEIFSGRKMAGIHRPI